MKNRWMVALVKRLDGRIEAKQALVYEDAKKSQSEKNADKVMAAMATAARNPAKADYEHEALRASNATGEAPFAHNRAVAGDDHRQAAIGMFRNEPTLGAINFNQKTGALMHTRIEPTQSRQGSDVAAKEYGRYQHYNAAKMYENAAQQHLKAAGTLKAEHITELAATASHEAHFGNGDHFEAAQLHSLAAEKARSQAENAAKSAESSQKLAERYPKYKESHEQNVAASRALARDLTTKAEHHEAFARDHQTLTGGTLVNGAGEVSNKQFPGHDTQGRSNMIGTKPAAEVSAKVAAHVAEAGRLQGMAEAHKTEAAKENPASSDAEWDESKHPRDEGGKFS